ncbi:MAG: 4-alpha-glucanotransferase [Planctomycetota bacterium]
MNEDRRKEGRRSAAAPRKRAGRRREDRPHPVPFPRRAGALLPLASLPSRHGIGDLGPEAHRFVAWCAEAGLGWWQMLPVGPLGPGDSPYSSSSAFAGEPLYLSLEHLVDDGLLATTDVHGPASLAQGKVQLGAARAFKEPRLRAAFAAWGKRGGARKAFDAFCADAAPWLEPWARYVGGDEGYTRFLQFQFQRQWSALRGAARAANLRVMGDAPIFVGADSADVAMHRELFRLDADGRPTVLTDCPPDSFSADGQLWGHPHYAWDAHRADGFAWWRRRIARQLELFDAVRIDHFIGFHHAWEVPGQDTTARHGKWGRTPGRELLEAIAREVEGALPLIAEDLGAVTDEVLALRDAFQLPGMRVLQWGFGAGSYHAPFRCPENSVVYPGTHDNDTVQGWWKSVDADTKRRFRSFTGGAAATAHWDMWRAACASPAHTAIVQMQDLLGLGRVARTNLPGTATGNWSWRIMRRDLSHTLAKRTRELALATDRQPH